MGKISTSSLIDRLHSKKDQHVDHVSPLTHFFLCNSEPSEFHHTQREHGANTNASDNIYFLFLFFLSLPITLFVFWLFLNNRSLYGVTSSMSLFSREMENLHENDNNLVQICNIKNRSKRLDQNLSLFMNNVLRHKKKKNPILR